MNTRILNKNHVCVSNFYCSLTHFLVYHIFMSRTRTNPASQPASPSSRPRQHGHANGRAGQPGQPAELTGQPALPRQPSQPSDQPASRPRHASPARPSPAQLSPAQPSHASRPTSQPPVGHPKTVNNPNKWLEKRHASTKKLDIGWHSVVEKSLQKT